MEREKCVKLCCYKEVKYCSNLHENRKAQLNSAQKVVTMISVPHALKIESFQSKEGKDEKKGLKKVLPTETSSSSPDESFSITDSASDSDTDSDSDTNSDANSDSSAESIVPAASNHFLFLGESDLSDTYCKQLRKKKYSPQHRNPNLSPSAKFLLKALEDSEKQVPIGVECSRNINSDPYKIKNFEGEGDCNINHITKSKRTEKKIQVQGESGLEKLPCVYYNKHVCSKDKNLKELSSSDNTSLILGQKMVGKTKTLKQLICKSGRDSFQPLSRNHEKNDMRNMFRCLPIASRKQQNISSKTQSLKDMYEDTLYSRSDKSDNIANLYFKENNLKRDNRCKITSKKNKICKKEENEKKNLIFNNVSPSAFAQDGYNALPLGKVSEQPNSRSKFLKPKFGQSSENLSEVKSVGNIQSWIDTERAGSEAQYERERENFYVCSKVLNVFHKGVVCPAIKFICLYPSSSETNLEQGELCEEVNLENEDKQTLLSMYQRKGYSIRKCAKKYSPKTLCLALKSLAAQKHCFNIKKYNESEVKNVMKLYMQQDKSCGYRRKSTTCIRQTRKLPKKDSISTVDDCLISPEELEKIMSKNDYLHFYHVGSRRNRGIYLYSDERNSNKSRNLKLHTIKRNFKKRNEILFLENVIPLDMEMKHSLSQKGNSRRKRKMDGKNSASLNIRPFYKTCNCAHNCFEDQKLQVKGTKLNKLLPKDGLKPALVTIQQSGKNWCVKNVPSNSEKDNEISKYMMKQKVGRNSASISEKAACCQEMKIPQTPSVIDNNEQESGCDLTKIQNKLAQLYKCIYSLNDNPCTLSSYLCSEYKERKSEDLLNALDALRTEHSLLAKELKSMYNSLEESRESRMSENMPNNSMVFQEENLNNDTIVADLKEENNDLIHTATTRKLDPVYSQSSQNELSLREKKSGINQLTRCSKQIFHGFKADEVSDINTLTEKNSLIDRQEKPKEMFPSAMKITEEIINKFQQSRNREILEDNIEHTKISSLIFHTPYSENNIVIPDNSRLQAYNLSGAIVKTHTSDTSVLSHEAVHTESEVFTQSTSKISQGTLSNCSTRNEIQNDRTSTESIFPLQRIELHSRTTPLQENGLKSPSESMYVTDFQITTESQMFENNTHNTGDNSVQGTNCFKIPSSNKGSTILIQVKHQNKTTFGIELNIPSPTNTLKSISKNFPTSNVSSHENIYKNSNKDFKDNHMQYNIEDAKYFNCNSIVQSTIDINKDGFPFSTSYAFLNFSGK